jgi:catechol-2,3-dioxygenase
VSEDEYDLAKSRLLDAGHPVQEELPEGGRALYVSDPEGNVVELNTKHGSGLLGG